MVTGVAVGCPLPLGVVFSNPAVELAARQ